MGKLTKERLLGRKIFESIDLTKLTDKQMVEIDNIIEVYDTKTIKNRLVNIRDFILYGVEDDWLGRIKIIREVLKNDVTSDYALEIRYGKNNVDKIKKTFKSKYGITEERFINKYGDKEGFKKWVEYKIKSKTPWGLDMCVEKYGEIEGPKKWDERLTKKIKTMSERKKVMPYRNGRTLDEYQNRYGIEEGFKRWSKRNQKQSNRFSKQYYINNYGDDIGETRWLEYCKSMDKTSLSSFINRYGSDLGQYKYGEYINKIRSSEHKRYYSKISQELFWGLYNKIDEGRDLVKFAELNGEQFFYPNEEWGRVFAVDFKFGNKIIEFDGDYWHNREDTKLIDKKRDEYLTNKGYQVLRVLESEYRNDAGLIIEKCLSFINNN